MGVLTVDIRREVLIFICNRGKYISRILKSCFYFWTDINKWNYEKKILCSGVFILPIWCNLCRGILYSQKIGIYSMLPAKSVSRKKMHLVWVYVFCQQKRLFTIMNKKKNLLWFLLVKPRANIELCTVLFRVDNNVLNFKSSE